MGFLINALIYILNYNFKRFIGFNLPISDIIIYLIMFGIVFFKVIKYNRLDNKEKRNFYINLLPILGVIGTFLGICLGLANFDSTEIESSVPQLLQGLKTAFWTSFIGTSWAVFLNIRYSSKDKEENDEEEEISLLKLQIEELQKLNTNFYNLAEENKKEKDSLYQINKEMLDAVKANNIMQEQLSQMEDLKAIKQELILLNQKQDTRDEILNKVLDSLNSSKLILEDINSLKEILNTTVENQNTRDEYLNKILDNMNSSKSILENILSLKEILSLILEKQNNKDEPIKLILEKFEKLQESSNLQVEKLGKIEEYTFSLDDIYNSLEDLKEKADGQISQLENLEKLNILEEIKNNIDSQLEDISVANTNIITKLDSLEKYDSNIFANSSKSLDFISSIHTKVEEYKNIFNNFMDNSTRENSELILAFKEFSNYMLEENSKAFIEALNKTIRDFNINLVETFGSNFKQLNEAVAKLLDWQEHYKDTIELTTENQKTIFNSFRNIETELDNFNQKTKGINTVVSELSLATKEALEQNYKFNDSLEVLAQLDDQVKELLPNFMKINSNLDDNLKTFSEETNKITDELKDFTSNLGLSLDKSKNQVNKLLEDTIKSFSTTIEKSEENNKEIVRSTSEKIKTLNDELDKNIKEKINKIDNFLKEQVQKTDNALKDNLNDVIKMLGNISEKFAEDYEPLANKLREIVQLPNLIENDKKVK